MNDRFSIPESAVPEIPTLRRYWSDPAFRAQLEAKRVAKMREINAEISANMEIARAQRLKDRAYREMLEAANGDDSDAFETASSNFRAAREYLDRLKEMGA